jgi:hypothetical protein
VFFGFLEALRRRKVPVGLHEALALRERVHLSELAHECGKHYKVIVVGDA